MMVSGGRSQLYSGLKTAKELWEETKRHWQDSVSKDFEANCLDPLSDEVQQTLRAIDRLAGIFDQMKSECGEQ